jgi:hypothetical protein
MLQYQALREVDGTIRSIEKFFQNHRPGALRRSTAAWPSKSGTGLWQLLGLLFGGRRTVLFDVLESL